MSIDIVQELNVRAVAHNLALRFSPQADEDDVLDYALRLAGLMCTADEHATAVAGVALWRAARGDGQSVRIDVPPIDLTALLLGEI